MNILSCPKCKNELIMDQSSGELHCSSCSYSIPSTEYEHPALGSASKSTYIKECAKNNVNVSLDCGAPTNITDSDCTYYIPHKKIKSDIYKSIPRLARPFLKSSFIKAVKGMKYERIMIPIWVNECKTSASQQGVGETFNDKATNFFIFEQEGTFTFDTVLTNATSKLDPSTIHGLFPFVLDKKYKMENGQDLACTLYPHDISPDYHASKIEAHVKETVKDKLKSLNNSFDSIHNKNFNILQYETVSSLLYLPAWKILYEHSSKDDDIYVNGQSAKIIGRLPLSRIKFALWFLISCSVLFAIIYGIYSIIQYLL